MFKLISQNMEIMKMSGPWGAMVFFFSINIHLLGFILLVYAQSSLGLCIPGLKRSKKASKKPLHTLRTT